MTVANMNDVERDNLVNEHMGIVIYMTNKYRHLDDDWDELQAWAYLGFSEAIHKFENDKDVDLASIAFDEIKKAFYRHYYRKGRPKSQTSLDKPAFESADEDALMLEGVISSDVFHYGEKDIMKILDESLFEEQCSEKDITIDFLMQDKTMKELSMEYNKPLARVRRITRRGQDLIKLYLSNNDIISDHLLHPTKHGEIKKHKYKKIDKEDCEKIKFIRIEYPHLTITDIAALTDMEPYVITQEFDYPTTEYIRCVPDNSIKDKVERYCLENYPERQPSDVEVFEMV